MKLLTTLLCVLFISVVLVSCSGAGGGVQVHCVGCENKSQISENGYTTEEVKEEISSKVAKFERWHKYPNFVHCSNAGSDTKVMKCSWYICGDNSELQGLDTIKQHERRSKGKIDVYYFVSCGATSLQLEGPPDPSEYNLMPLERS